MRSALFVLALVSAGLLAGCSNGSGGSSTPPPVTLTSIAVTPATPTIPVGTLQQFTATGTYSDQSTKDLTAQVTWSSSNTAVASTASGGLLTAMIVNSSPVTVTATLSSVSGTTAVTVATASLTSIEIVGAPTVTIANGTSYQFTAYGFYNDGSRHNVTTQATWSSSNTAAATVGTTGRAASSGVGSTTVTATVGSIAGTVTLDVTSATIVSMVVAPSTTTIAPQTVQAFTAIGTFSDSTTQNITHDVTWTSNNTGVATISNSSGNVGVATGVATGSSTISASFQSVTGTQTLTVSPVTLSSIAVTSPSAGMAAGSLLALQAVGTFTDGSTQHLETVFTWSSSDTTIATVSANIVSGVATGAVTIGCSLGAVSGTANLTVEGLTAITISPASATLAQGTSTALTAKATLTDGTTQDVTNSAIWTSSNSTVVTLSAASGSFGAAIGSAPGNSTVTAVLAGQVGLSPVTVTSATLTSLAITPVNPQIALGARQSFSAKGTFSDGSTQDLGSQVVWTSSDLTTAIINSTGAALTTGPGSTTISASLAGVSDTTVLTVQCGECIQ